MAAPAIGANAVTGNRAVLHSPLQERITRDGISVDVMIYRAGDEEGWILEVVDHLGGSTIWDDPFPTDQAAYDEAMAAIEEDGIGSFAAAEARVVH
jgi:uncharacterized protein